jgi:hypothetical protein
MMLRLAQDAERAGRTAWQWAVWLEGPRDELEAVKEVVYTLHPTFPQPVRRLTNSENKFRLKAKGWGEFLIRARVIHRDGTSTELSHWLQLGPPSSTVPQKSLGTPGHRQVFLSATAADAAFAAEITGALLQKGIDVATSEDIPPNGDLQENLQREMRASQALLLLVTSRVGAWAEAEIEAFRSQDKPVLGFLLVGPFRSVNRQDELPSIDWVTIKWSADGSHAAGIAEHVVQAIDGGGRPA